MILDYAVFLWDHFKARWHRLPPLLAVPLRAVPEPLTDEGVERLLTMLRQPIEIEANESVIDLHTGWTWVYTAGRFERTPRNDTPSERAFIADFLANHPGWPAA